MPDRERAGIADPSEDRAAQVEKRKDGDRRDDYAATSWQPPGLAVGHRLTREICVSERDNSRLRASLGPLAGSRRRQRSAPWNVLQLDGDVDLTLARSTRD